MEDIFFAYNPKTVLKLAKFRGALALKILQIHGEFSEYTPLQIKKTVTGKLIYPIADLFIVQWKEMLKLYPNAIYGGSIF